MCPLTHFENLVRILFLMPIPTIIQFEISKKVKVSQKIVPYKNSRFRLLCGGINKAFEKNYLYEA
jgi:hypothetical protein